MSFNSKYTGLQIEDLLDKVDKGSVGGGGVYPVVTIKDNFTIDAQPNTFYNIKNSEEDSVNINIKDEDLYIEDMNKLLLIDFGYDSSNNIMYLLQKLLSLVGVIFIEDNSKEGYSYKAIVDLMIFGYDGISEMWVKQYPTSGINLECMLNASSLNLTNQEAVLNNITVLNETEDYLGFKLDGDIGGKDYNFPIIFKDEIISDKDEYSYCYNGISSNAPAKIYTNISYPKCNSYYILCPVRGSLFSSIPVQLNKNIKGSGVANEFIFNINSPANVIFNQNIKWDIEPDFTKKGTYTISIIDGKGSYKFIK